MDRDGHKRVCVEGSSKVEWLSILPESLLCKVLLNLPTKDVVRTSVLSKRWTNLWRYVPGLDMDECYFPDHKTFDSFVDTFLSFNSESYLECFKLNYSGYNDEVISDYEPEIGIVTRWINTVVNRKVKDLFVVDNTALVWDSWEVQIPSSLYTCESLVSLKLHGVKLESLMFVSLPCLKFMDIAAVKVANVLDLEKLISSCPVLESLTIVRDLCDGIEVLRVFSQSLLRFTHVCNTRLIPLPWTDNDLVVAINAPKLQYLRLGDDCIESFILTNTSSLKEAYIDTYFNWSFEIKFENDLQKRKMFRSILEGISCVKDMTITSKSLEVIYYYSNCEQLPLFRRLSSLRVRLANYEWEMLPIFLESCPNLKSIVVADARYFEEEEIRILSGPPCLLLSLEYVDIERPLRRNTREMELVSYFLENSPSLKKLTVRLDAYLKTAESVRIFKELLATPRLSSSCQVVVSDRYIHSIAYPFLYNNI